MRWFQQLRMRILMLFGRAGAASHLDDELSFHLERQIDENIAAGMSPDEARHAALRQFGNPALLREQTRATWSWSSIESIIRDMRIGARTLLRTPGFTLIAIFVMALGLGANVASLPSCAESSSNRCPYADPGRLIMLYESEHAPPPEPSIRARSIRQLLRLADVSQPASSRWQWSRRSRATTFPLKAANLPERIEAGWCSWNFFSILGVQPALGRDFTAEDDRPGATATVAPHHPFWKRRYSADPLSSERPLARSHPYTVIGVLSRLVCLLRLLWR